MTTISPQARISNRYVLGESLGQGLGSTVTRGEDETLRRPVAVKQVHPEHTAAYRTALGATARIGHPAYIGVYDALEVDGQLVIIQEFVIGQRFTELAQARLSPPSVARIGRQLALALAHAHRQGIAHGDLTPAALFRDQWGAMRINNILLPPDAAYFTAASRLLKPGDAPWDFATPTPQGDLRAVGVALWLLLAGRDAPADEATGAQADWELAGREIPLNLRDVVERLIDSDHPRALDSAEEAVAALGAIIHGEDVPPPRGTPPWSLPPSRADVAETNPSHQAATDVPLDPPEPPTQPNIAFTASALRAPVPPIATRTPTAWPPRAPVAAPAPREAPAAPAPPNGGRFDYAIWAVLGLGLFLFWVLVGYFIPGLFGR